MAIDWSLKVRADDLGPSADQSDAVAFYDWGNADCWDNPYATPRGKISLGFLGFGTLPEYDVADASTTIDVYWQDYASNTGSHATVPWNPSWEWGESEDAFMMITDGLTNPLENEGWEMWRVYDIFQYGDGKLRPWGPEWFGPIHLDELQDVWTRGWRPGDLLVGQIHYRAADKANVGYQGHGGAAAPLAAGTLLGSELAVAAAANSYVPHAITVAGMNPHNGPGAVEEDLWSLPGNRVERTTHATVYASIDTDPSGGPISTKLYKEGCRIRGKKTTTEIDAWLDAGGFTGALRSAKRALAYTICEMGFVLWETGFGVPLIYSDAVGYGPSQATWAAMGVTSSTIAGNMLLGLFDSVDDFEVVEPTALLIETEPEATVPDAPVLTDIELGVDGDVLLDWSAPYDGGSPITEYRVYLSYNDPDDYSYLGSVSGEPPATNFGNFPAFSGTLYYKVTAVNAIGESVASNVLTIEVELPTVPGEPEITATGYDGHVLLEWPEPDDGGSPITSYVIYRAPQVGEDLPDFEDFTFLTSVDGDILEYDDTDVENGTTYYYRMYAVNDEGNGPYSAYAVATPEAVEFPARQLSSTSVGSTVATVTLSAFIPPVEPELIGYSMYRSTSPDSGFVLIDSGIVPGALDFPDTGLTNGVTYYYQMTTNYVGGSSVPSNVVSATPVGEEEPPPDDVFRLIWGNPEDKNYEYGIDRGVIHSKAGLVIPWPGLISVSESREDSEKREIFFDGLKIEETNSGGVYSCQVTGLQLPSAFDSNHLLLRRAIQEIIGHYDVRPGLTLTGQRKRAFDFSYRSMVNETDYKLHFVWNALMHQEDAGVATLSDGTTVSVYTWAIETAPAEVYVEALGRNVTDHLYIDSRKVSPELLQEVETILYGTESTVPRFPSMAELVEVIA